ncbi:hypothetical protein ACFL1B_03375 [Nanoarchaeota archaeon]
MKFSILFAFLVLALSLFTSAQTYPVHGYFPNTGMAYVRYATPQPAGCSYGLDQVGPYEYIRYPIRSYYDQPTTYLPNQQWQYSNWNNMRLAPNYLPNSYGPGFVAYNYQRFNIQRPQPYLYEGYYKFIPM